MNTDGINSTNDITLSGDSEAYFDVLSSGKIILPRNSTAAVNADLGSTIDVGQTLENVYFGHIDRLFVIENDIGGNMLFLNTATNRTELTCDVISIYPNTLSINSATLFDTGSVNFSNCPTTFSNTSVSFPGSTATFNSNLPTTTITTGFTTSTFITKGYGDSAYAAIGSGVSLAGTNAWTGTNSYNVNLPTSTLTPTTATQLVTKIFVDSTFGRLAFANAWTNTNTFNSFLPTSTLNPTSGTQLITKNFGDGAYGRLATANTWAELNTFSKGILPRTTLTATNIQISSNAMVNRQAASLNCIGIGENSVAGDQNPAGYIYNTGSNCIGIGKNALQTNDGCSSNIAIGVNALQNIGGQRLYGAGVLAQRNIAIGENSQNLNIAGNDNVTIGYNSYNSNISGQGNVMIGSNTGNGLSDRNFCVVLGTNSCPSATDNQILSIGYNAMGSATGTANSVVAVGPFAGYNNTNGTANQYFGALAGYDNVGGSDSVFVGYAAGTGSSAGESCVYVGRATNTTFSNPFNSIAIGFNAQIQESYEFVIGGSYGGTFPRLTIPNKTRLACNQALTGVTINLSFRTNENILLTDATTTTINLPTPATVNIGCKYFIQRQVTGLAITINAPAGQLVAYLKNDGTYTTASSYTFNKVVANIRLLCIDSSVSGANWIVMNTLNAEAADTIYTNATVSIPATKYSLPFGGTATGYNNMYSDNTNLNYQASTTTLTATSITSSGTITASGTLNATGTFRITNYRPYEIGAIVNNATALPGAPSTLYGSYTFSSGTADAVVVLPTISVAMTGCSMVIRRIANTSFQLIIKTAAGSGTTIIQRGSIATTAENTNYILLTTAQFITTIMPISTTQWTVIS